MHTVNIHDAKTHFSQLIKLVLQGNEVVIAMAGKPVAKLCPITDKPNRRFGVHKGKIKIAKDFDARLSNDFIADFE